MLSPKITKVSYYPAPGYQRRVISQSHGIIEIETDAGISGIGEGGSPDLVSQLARFLIGEDPLRIEHLWQTLFRADFYPAGRELTHALGGLDMALWDIKGKLLDVPVYQLLGGRYRDHIECYATAFDPENPNLAEAARKCMDFGYAAYRTTGLVDNSSQTFDDKKAVSAIYRQCEAIANELGDDGFWAIDFHTRFDPIHAIELAKRLEPLKPLFCEDLVRSEHLSQYRSIRQQTSAPLAAGEQLSHRWECQDLIKEKLIDFARITLPNVGGITELRKILSELETQFITFVPHFTGPISTAALVHCGISFPGRVIQEIVGTGPAEKPYLNSDYIIFKEGKLYPNDHPGIGVTLVKEKLTKTLEVTERDPHAFPIFKRPDGSYTNW
ncbi:mandelate racemase/muconate lactonizing enzyme family protein [Pelagicoccus mobilis]|uniref:Mandelate racemase/muconate lactonizing enzyme family protein n=1 Tax=Pelagicoccus mobilis TaxID=415221 RepID=A0A934RVW8_9BACT|nr:mandelate racemase/muconate lactonizing enzyme family protein [Pelagicoccus mobilis]MBK1877787.1 mandelate racemase/muconate lactonizing enzyme family protein [Pelagicoccus mobilis]